MTMNNLFRISRRAYQLLKHQHIRSLLTIFGSSYNTGNRFASIKVWAFLQSAAISDVLVNINFCIPQLNKQHAHCVIILF